MIKFHDKTKKLKYHKTKWPKTTLKYQFINFIKRLKNGIKLKL